MAAAQRGHTVSEETRRKIGVHSARNFRKMAIHRFPYNGQLYLSRLEVAFAQHLDRLGLTWQYEPCIIRLPTGRSYIPDFYVREWYTYVEVKGWSGWGSLDKVDQARAAGYPVLYATSRGFPSGPPTLAQLLQPFE